MTLPTAKILIDSSAFVPAADLSHPLHAVAASGFRTMEESETAGVLTDHVYGESFTVIRRMLGNAEARAFLAGVARCERAGVLRVEMATREDLDRAASRVFRVRSKRFSFVDALNVVVAKRLGIRTFFAFDHHFFTRFPLNRWS